MRQVQGVQADAVAVFAKFVLQGHRLLWRFNPLRVAGGNRLAVLQQPAHLGVADAAQGAGDDGDWAGWLGHVRGWLRRPVQWLCSFSFNHTLMRD